MEKNNKKICLDCGEILPYDSEFCQYCGSANIKKAEMHQLKCLDCGREVPNDSCFCPYCGSKNLYTNEGDIKTVLVCDDCGKELPADSKYCQYCGSEKINTKTIVVHYSEYCPYCGHRVSSSETECPNCHKKLPIVTNGVTGNQNQPSQFSHKKKQFKETKTKLKKTFLFAVPILLIAILSVFISMYLSEEPEIEFSNGKIVNNFNITNAFRIEYKEFNVTAPANKSVYVVIKNKSTNTVGSFLIKEGESSSVYVKTGNYDVFYAVGKKWQGKEKLFGFFTEYYKDTASFNTSYLNYGYRWTTDFSSLRDEVVKVSKKEFPEY